MHRAAAFLRLERPPVMTNLAPVVFVVDDDVSVRESLQLLIADAGWCPELCASAHEFLDRPRPSRPSCLILDVTLPDLNGLELQKRIAGDRAEMPIIFVTGNGHIPMTVDAMKGGAVEFLTKPVAPTILLNAIETALARSRAALDEVARLLVLRERYESLSARERQVMALVVCGKLNKQIGGELGIEEITVKAHRGRMMRKMGARSVPELVTVASQLGLRTAGKA